MSTQTITIAINHKNITCTLDNTILDAALNAGIYIPSLCYHPDLPPFGACGLCTIQIEGLKDPKLACNTTVKPGMKILTDTPEIKKIRKEKLTNILTNHPHACLVCAEKEGCAREPCSLNVKGVERCCSKLGNCEIERIADYIGIPEDTPRYTPQNFPKYTDNPFIERDYNLCIGCSRCIRACERIRGANALGDLPDPPNLVDPTDFPEKLLESGCQFCGVCIDVCPTGALINRIEKIKDSAPCQISCPAHINIPQFLREISQHRFTEALTTMYQTIPFPGTLGYVCYHPCETDCRRDELDDAVAIRVLKRLAFEQTDKIQINSPQKKSNKKIAVVGSGPAGLTCAFYLNQWGHSVTVFEAQEKPGGMLRYGIPTFRLPRHILEKEIDIIKKTGINIKTNTPITTLDELTNQGFNVIFIAIGAQKGSTLKIKGEDDPEVLDALQFLQQVYGKTNTKKMVQTDAITLGKKVAVIGGGNTAIDAARTAVRLGSTVTIIYRRSENEMPAYLEEINEAKTEGIQFQFLTTPVAIQSTNKGLQVELIKMKLGPKDARGRPQPIPIKNCTITKDFDNLIIAVGQEITPINGMKLNINGWPEYNTTTLSITDGVYIGGDVIKPASVVEAVAIGRTAAQQIHQYLDGTKEDTQISKQKPPPQKTNHATFLKKRMIIPKISSEKRLSGFTEIEESLEKNIGTDEANRCFQCDLCLYLSEIPQPPVDLLPFQMKTIQEVPQTAGVYTTFDENKKIIEIKGTANLQNILREKLETDDTIKFFTYEEDPMYSKRESELLQQYAQKYGELPSGGDDLDDLF
ncbi:MAG: FAD-dependent oxidoreductase [Candidatus Thermoplasmatota archaeon]|nr:FAD-dependent oxidoreductase [Candidatus Thermoplasmatota archaeon]MBU1940439.1 FAD-dependent oxidoreductase [Candidatus Thermoplasmatota archaeon]